jgi:hypothetical protein
MTNMMDDHATQQVEQAYLALAEIWPEVMAETDSGSWLAHENETLNNVEKLFDDVY